MNAYPNHGNCCVSSAIDRVCIVFCIIFKTFFVWEKKNNFKNNNERISSVILYLACGPILLGNYFTTFTTPKRWLCICQIEYL